MCRCALDFRCTLRILHFSVGTYKIFSHHEKFCVEHHAHQRKFYLIIIIMIGWKIFAMKFKLNLFMYMVLQIASNFVHFLSFHSVSQAVSIPLKYLCLFTLVIQTSTLVLALRYSRKTSANDGQKYLSSTAVVVSEVIKLFTCCMVLFKKSENSISLFKRDMKNQIFGNWTDSIKLMVPAVLYTIQNNLLFLALSYLDAATYQVSCLFYFHI